MQSIDVFTERLVELAGGAIDESEARALVTEIHEAAMLEEREELAEREAEREE
ncbi:hypothetical protein ACTWP5_02805 [Streptomyces sp. 4N509B]|uniref:hypothetical protein n=1 Tax=Streptomyces sp. 4N509B TaxID=3457413 RepID=UPI003FD34932